MGIIYIPDQNITKDCCQSESNDENSLLKVILGA